MTLHIDTKVMQYLRLRDYKKSAEEELKKSLARVNEAMRALEVELLQELNTSGADHIGCKNGTVYKRTELTCTVDDRDGFLNYIVENDEWDALDVKANKTFIRSKLDAGETPPTGVKISTFETIGVRR